jgi:hypothetical protein
MQGKDVTPFYDNFTTNALMGRFGNILLVNGAEAYNLEVQQGDVIRFYDRVIEEHARLPELGKLVESYQPS